MSPLPPPPPHTHINHLVSQSMEIAKDIVFPSRVLKRQLEDAQHRLKEMEEELETMKNKEQRERKRQKMTKVPDYIDCLLLSAHPVDRMMISMSICYMLGTRLYATHLALSQGLIQGSLWASSPPEISTLTINYYANVKVCEW